VVAFAHEVRRHYPFVPLLAARAREDTQVCGVALRAGERAVLDVYGTNHDPRWWSHPDTFDPGRFEGTEPDEFAFVPQGGGDARTGHRCPGEGIATGILTAVVPALARRSYDLAPSNGLMWSARRMPPRFRGGLRILSATRRGSSGGLLPVP
jgi:fatty-acid peroxygenase